MRYFSIASLSGLGALVAWFSVIHSSVPLLAPALILVSLFALSMFGLGLRKKHWVCINDDDNIRITQIRLSSRETPMQATARRIFEDKLSEAIEAAKQQEYYNLD